MEVVAHWNVDGEEIEIRHENPNTDEEGRWEYRVDGEVRMFGRGTPSSAREAVATRRKLRYPA